MTTPAADAALHVIKQDEAKSEAAAIAARSAEQDRGDKLWLAQQVADLATGIEAAHAIVDNWTARRNVSRLHPGMSLGQYIASLNLRLKLPEALALLPEGSNRQVAIVAGINERTVRRGRAAANAAPDARVIGADGKSYPGRVVRPVVVEQIDEPAPDPVVVVVGIDPCATWAAMVAAAGELAGCMTRGWPVVADRTPKGWVEVWDEINEVGRVLLALRGRVADLLNPPNTTTAAKADDPPNCPEDGHRMVAVPGGARPFVCTWHEHGQAVTA